MRKRSSDTTRTDCHDRREDAIAFDGEQAALARQGFATLGKGRHPAGLNFEDCAVHGLAKASAERILFKGEDFSKADAPIVNLS